MLNQRIKILFTLVTFWVSGSANVEAQLSINAWSPSGLTIGQTNTLVIRGKQLDASTRLVAPFPFKQISVQAKADQSEAALKLELPTHASPGITHFRVLTDRGLSQAIPISLDRLPQVAIENVRKPLDPTRHPVALTGHVSSSHIVSIDLLPSQTQTIYCETESVRLGSKLRPVLRILDESGNQLAWSQPSSSLGGDTRLKIELQKGQNYQLQLADQLRKAPANSIYRLKIGQFVFADLVRPVFMKAAVPLGENLLSVQSESEMKLHWAPRSFFESQYFSGTRPLSIRWADQHIDLTSTSTIKNHLLGQIPCAVSAILDAPEKLNSFLLKVQPKQKLRFEIFADQIGSSLDSVVTIFDHQSNRRLAQADDYQSLSDPRLDLVVPANVQQLRIELRDVTGKIGADLLYGMTVKDISSGTFEIFVDQPVVTLAPGQRQLIKVRPVRQGYNESIPLDVICKNSKLLFSSSAILPGADHGFVTVENHGNERIEPEAILIRGSTNDTQFESFVQLGKKPNVFRQSWLDQQVMIAPSKVETLSIVANWPAELDLNKPLLLFENGALPTQLLTRVSSRENSNQKLVVKLNSITSKLVAAKQKGQPPTQPVLDVAILKSDLEQTSFLISAKNGTPPGIYSMVVDLGVHEQSPMKNSKRLAGTFSKPVMVNVEKGIDLKLSGPARLVAKPENSSLTIEGTLTWNPKLNGNAELVLEGFKIAKNKLPIKSKQERFSWTIPVPSKLTLDQLSKLTIHVAVSHKNNNSVSLAKSKLVKLFE